MARKTGIFGIESSILELIKIKKEVCSSLPSCVTLFLLRITSAAWLTNEAVVLY